MGQTKRGLAPTSNWCINSRGTSGNIVYLSGQVALPLGRGSKDSVKGVPYLWLSSRSYSFYQSCFWLSLWAGFRQLAWFTNPVFPSTLRSGRSKAFSSLFLSENKNLPANLSIVGSTCTLPFLTLPRLYSPSSLLDQTLWSFHPP